ncbi:MAG: hypothetical protein ACLSEY_01720 [Enterocloster sp.]
MCSTCGDGNRKLSMAKMPGNFEVDCAKLDTTDKRSHVPRPHRRL